MLRRLFTAALMGGIAAGFISAALQMLLTYPILDAAEHLEAASGDGHSHDHAADLIRHSLTFAANIIVYCGFGFVVAALMEWFKPQTRTSLPPTFIGVLWGIAGYFCIIIAPTLGLPPELPGTPAVDITIRQIWWLAAVLCASVSLWLAFLAPFPLVIRWVVAILLFAAPHIYGAPHPQDLTSDIPAVWGALFTARSSAIAFIAWIILGSIAALKIYQSSE